jgi:signal peptidase II
MRRGWRWSSPASGISGIERKLGTQVKFVRKSPLILTAIVILLLDQASKLVVLLGLGLDRIEAYDVLPPFLVFRMAWNRGVNFGFLADDSALVRWGLILLALAISVWVWIWVRRQGHGIWAQVSAGLLIGGAMGNVIDRLSYGAVADFLNMSCCGIENPFSFNIADVGVFLGAVGLVLTSGGKSGTGKNGPARPAVRRNSP